MSNETETIFKAHDDWWHNACLQDYMEFSQLASYYLRAANDLVEKTVDDRGKLDVYIYSAVFLYRHSIELVLKELIWMSNYLLGRGKSFPKIHRLIELWESLKSNTKSLLAADFPLCKADIQSIESALHEYAKHDPESDSFRYPFDKKMKRTHSDVTHINVRVLYETFNRIHELLARISCMVGYLYNEQAMG